VADIISQIQGLLVFVTFINIWCCIGYGLLTACGFDFDEINNPVSKVFICIVPILVIFDFAVSSINKFMEKL